MLNYKHLKNKKIFSVCGDNIFLFFVNLTCFPMIENFKIMLQRLSRMTKHVSKAGNVAPGDRVTLHVPVKFASKPVLTLSCLLG